MRNIKNIKLKNDFFQFENNNSVFSMQISGIYFWKLIRVRMYRIISQNTKSKSTHKKAAFNFLNYTYNSVFYSKNNCETIFFENPRKIKRDLSYFDPYTKYYIDEFHSDDIDIEIVDDGHLGYHYEKKNKLRSFNHSFYYDIFLKFFYSFSKLNAPLNYLSMLNALETKFDKEFQVSSNLTKIVQNEIINFNLQFKKYGAIYDLKNCKEIYIICSYGKEGMIHAAKIRDIKVVEFQHGNMGPYHMGYHFPNTNDVPYFPDRLLLFGELWNDVTSFPPTEVSVIGYKHLNETLKNYINIEKQEKNILVISQPSVADKLIPFIMSTASNNPDYTFKYRLHPKEKKEWKSKYSKLVNNCLVNFEVDVASEDIYSAIAKSELVIGVHSTTIFECLMFEKNIVLIDLPGVENLSFLIDKSYVKLVSHEIPLFIDLIDFSQEKPNKNYIFDGFSKKY